MKNIENKNCRENLLELNLSKYRDISVKLIECAENEDYDFLEDLLNERQRVIENIELLQYSKEEFTQICNKLNILSLQKKLDEVMNEKRGKVKKELESLKERKNARKTYNKAYAMDYVVFNRTS